MVITNIIGGLGNQMFQYAIGRAISLRTKNPLKLDISGFKGYDLRKYELDVFNINASIASDAELEKFNITTYGLIQKIINKLLLFIGFPQYKIFREKYYHYDPQISRVNQNTYLIGYWQSEKYFIEYENIIRDDFTLKHELSDESAKYNQLIRESTSIGLHVRRGDYVSNPSTNDYHGVCSLDYYKKAVSIIHQSTLNPCFFIFSDDLPWAKESFDFIENKIFLELSEAIPDYEELYLLSQCQHNIIANSSFSWWGAWLNRNPNKYVIAPKQWFADASLNTSDLIPASWIRV